MSNKDKGAPEPQSIGTWRLINRIFEVQDTGEKIADPWVGRMVIQPDGAFVFIMTKADRATPATVEERATAYNTGIAASGRVSVEGGQPFVQYDIASHPQLIGKVRVNTQYSGKRMHVTGEWSPSALMGNRVGRTISEWERD